MKSLLFLSWVFSLSCLFGFSSCASISHVSIHTEKCTTTYEEKCVPNIKIHCETITNKNYTMSVKHECETQIKEECETIVEENCNEHDGEECKTIEEQQCEISTIKLDPIQSQPQLQQIIRHQKSHLRQATHLLQRKILSELHY